MVALPLIAVLFAITPGDFHARLAALQEQVRRNPKLEEEQRSHLEASIADIDKALAGLEEVARKGGERRKRLDSIFAAAAAVAADDVTGIGAADDVLLPILGLAALTAHLRTEAPASEAEFRAALERLDGALEAAVRAGHTVRMAQQAGLKSRSLTRNVAQHLARILGRSVGGMPPDHQEDPEPTRPHWWSELKGYIEQIRRLKYTPKQLLRELRKDFTEEQLREIREAAREAAKLMRDDPPDFPPLATP